MAGDWIKMRGELLTHPRFLNLCSRLIYGEDAGLLLYTCGADALGIGVMPPSNETVTNRALRCVTEPALRDVTLSALLRVWCAVNAHCKVCGMDAVMSPMDIYDVNSIVGFDDFAEAMRDVGWIIEQDDNSLRFPNFLEFNEPACLRAKPKTNAERQREFREQKRQKDLTNECVTKVTKRNDREEKRREEKKEEKTPQPPATGGGIVKDVPVSTFAESVPIPAALDTPKFREMWTDWIAHRRSRRKPVTARAAREQFAKLGPLGPDLAADCVLESIRNDWQGVFPEKFSRGGSGGALFDHAARTESRILAQAAEANARSEGDG